MSASHSHGPQLRVPLLALGGCSLLWQVTSVRAVLSGLHGNEIAVGLVLACWLLLNGGASALGARIARIGLGTLLALMPLGFLSGLALQAQLPSVGGGELLGPGAAVLWSVLCLAPCAVPLGLGYGLASLTTEPEVEPARWAARLFLWESVGTVAAGALFHLLLTTVEPRAVALLAGGLCWGAAWSLLPPRGARRRALTCLLLGAAALVFLLPVAALPGQRLLEPHPPGYALVAQRHSPHAALYVTRRGDQLQLTANGVTLLTNQDQDRLEPAVHLSLLCHPSPNRVLMLGGALGGGVAEALKHPVEQLEVVELDPAVVQLARAVGRGLAGAGLSDGRVRLRFGDGRQIVRQARAAYDVILVQMPGPTSALINRYYTEEFFRQARRALRPGGVLRISLPGSQTYLGDNDARIHASVVRSLRRVFGQMRVLPGATTLLLARRGPPLSLPPALLARRLRQRGVQARTFGVAELVSRLLPFKAQLYLDRLVQVPALTNSDAHPRLYFRASLDWLARTSPRLSVGLQHVADALEPRPWLVPLVVLLLGLGWGLWRRTRRQLATGLAAAAVGLCGLAVEVTLLLALQSAHGVVYGELALLLSSFMAGLALGSALGGRLAPRLPRRGLQLAVLATALIAALGAVVAAVALAHPAQALLLCGATLLLQGVAVGATYPAVARTMAQTRARDAAARAYAWDLSGAALGALLSAALALPLLGLGGTCLAAAALCVGVGLTLASGGPAASR